MGKRIRRFLAVAFAASLATGVLAACGSDSDDSDGDGGGTEGDDKSQGMTIAYIPWDEDIAISYLWKYVLEEEGYEDVELKQLDAAPIFVALSKGDADFFFDTWLPDTHKDYWEDYGDQLDDIGVWYDEATLNIAVPEYMDVDSIADLDDVADDVDGKIIGIESGAGLSRTTKEALEDDKISDKFELVTSSTPAMLSELKKATDAEDPIVVTLWHPHWAYDAYPIKDLDDPDEAMGGKEEIHIVGREDVEDDFPTFREALSEWTMDDDTLASLENTVIEDHEDDPEEGVEEWVADNQEFVDQMADALK